MYTLYYITRSIFNSKESNYSLLSCIFVRSIIFYYPLLLCNQIIIHKLSIWHTRLSMCETIQNNVWVIFLKLAYLKSLWFSKNGEDAHKCRDLNLRIFILLLALSVGTPSYSIHYFNECTVVAHLKEFYTLSICAHVIAFISINTIWKEVSLRIKLWSFHKLYCH